MITTGSVNLQQKLLAKRFNNMVKTVTSPTTEAVCVHCGDQCAEERVERGKLLFCCPGCETVYRILQENDLLSFYHIDEAAGKKQKESSNRDYAWLEVPKLADRVVRYRDEVRCHIDLELPEIHCASCVWLLERLPQLLPGVRSCTVDYSRKVAAIAFNHAQVSLREVAEMLDRIGYPPHLKTWKEDSNKRSNRALIYRIGVAGFCFGNIMLLSFPEYFGLGASAGATGGADAGALWMGGALHYLLLALSLPVVFYAGRGFFTAAWHALMARRITIDLPIAIGMLALFSRSVFEIGTGTGSGYLDSLAGLVFFLLIGRWFQTLTFARLNFDRDYRDYFPVAAYREDATGTPEPVASEDLTAGDVLLVRPGNLIPADGKLLTDTTEGIDYSFVTGEALPRPAKAGQEVFAGGRATSSALRIAVTKPADQSYLLQLWLRESDGAKDTEVAPPEALIRAFTGFILLLAGATLAYWYGKDVSTAYRAATAVLIIACPCALALAAPFAYGTLQRLLAKAGYYFRGPAVLQRLGTIDAFVFDKTGTLTVGSQTEAITYATARSTFHDSVLLAMAQQSAHPRSRALATSLLAQAMPAGKVRTGSVEETVGQGIRLVHEGKEYRIGQAAFCGLTPAQPGTWASIDGASYLSLGGQGAALRPGVGTMLSEIRQRGDTWLLSGDQPPSSNFWSDYLAPEQTAFEQSPFDKRERVNGLQKAGANVLMVGDGLNDAGALGAATVGLAINEDEAHFNPACDGIVKADQLGLLPEILRVSGKMKWVLWLTYGLAFAYNVVGLSYAVTGTLSPVVAAILMPLSSVTIVVVAVLGAMLVNGQMKRKNAS